MCRGECGVIWWVGKGGGIGGMCAWRARVCGDGEFGLGG
jgi:hypothetical protein